MERGKQDIGRENAIFIIGAPRSGTTWLGKILDSCPDTDYRHEPDSHLKLDSPPPIVEPHDYDRYMASAKDYLAALIESRPASAMVKPPFFRKNVRLLPDDLCIAALYMLRAALRVPLIGNVLSEMNMPGFCSRKEHRKPVIKSVISLGRVGLLLRSMPQIRILIPVRHPCGFVASELRGVRQGKMASNMAVGALTRTSAAKIVGITLEYMAESDDITRFACAWTILHELALNAVQGNDNVRIVIHEDLASNPVEASRAIYDFCDLPWTSQTEAFVTTSSNADGASEYFGVYRNSREEAQKWQHELTQQEIQRIENIARMGRAYESWVLDKKSPVLSL